jgi:hypothetical protein
MRSITVEITYKKVGNAASRDLQMALALPRRQMDVRPEGASCDNDLQLAS